jgi:hypothetical protein
MMGPYCPGGVITILSDAPTGDYQIEWSNDGFSPNLGSYNYADYNTVIQALPMAFLPALSIPCSTAPRLGPSPLKSCLNH